MGFPHWEAFGTHEKTTPWLHGICCYAWMYVCVLCHRFPSIRFTLRKIIFHCSLPFFAWCVCVCVCWRLIRGLRGGKIENGNRGFRSTKWEKATGKTLTKVTTVEIANRAHKLHSDGFKCCQSKIKRNKIRLPISHDAMSPLEHCLQTIPDCDESNSKCRNRKMKRLW